jgi:hypothetical protein
MKFRLTLDCGNAAFDYPDHRAEVARILRETAAKLDGGREGGFLRDVNGNHVGTFAFTGKAPKGDNR